MSHSSHCLCYSRQCLLGDSKHYLLCHTVDIVCCITQQTLSAVRHSRQCLLSDTADIVSCVAQRTLSVASHSRQCLLRDAAELVCCVTGWCTPVPPTCHRFYWKSKSPLRQSLIGELYMTQTNSCTHRTLQAVQRTDINTGSEPLCHAY